ncbi:hypothetical protein BZU93_25775 [Salmonella enterica subsp. enterica]|nr:hypothetical protein [Salmonella enterica subsp. enterica serovar Enteritidis]
MDGFCATFWHRRILPLEIITLISGAEIFCGDFVHVTEDCAWLETGWRGVSRPSFRRAANAAGAMLHNQSPPPRFAWWRGLVMEPSYEMCDRIRQSPRCHRGIPDSALQLRDGGEGKASQSQLKVERY